MEFLLIFGASAFLAFDIVVLVKAFKLDYHKDSWERQYYEQRWLLERENEDPIRDITQEHYNFTDVIQRFLDSHYTDYIKVDIDNDFYDLNQFLLIINHHYEEIINQLNIKMTRQELLDAILDEVYTSFSKNGKSLSSFTDKNAIEFIKDTSLISRETKKDILKLYKNRPWVILDNKKRKYFFFDVSSEYKNNLERWIFNPDKDADYNSIIVDIATNNIILQSVPWDIGLLKKVVKPILEEHPEYYQHSYHIAYLILKEYAVFVHNHIYGEFVHNHIDEKVEQSTIVDHLKAYATVLLNHQQKRTMETPKDISSYLENTKNVIEKTKPKVKEKRYNKNN